jgi:hypothetical protein
LFGHNDIFCCSIEVNAYLEADFFSHLTEKSAFHDGAPFQESSKNRLLGFKKN